MKQPEMNDKLISIVGLIFHCYHFTGNAQRIKLSDCVYIYKSELPFVCYPASTSYRRPKLLSAFSIGSKFCSTMFIYLLCTQLINELFNNILFVMFIFLNVTIYRSVGGLHHPPLSLNFYSQCFPFTYNFVKLPCFALWL